MRVGFRGTQLQKELRKKILVAQILKIYKFVVVVVNVDVVVIVIFVVVVTTYCYNCCHK